MAKTKIDNYVFRPGMSYTGNLLPNAYSLINRNKSYIIAEATSYIIQQVAAGNSPFVGYTYNQAKCERDIGYVLDSYLNDLRYDGNEKTRETVSKYWENAVSQLDGDRQPEVVVHQYIRDLITDYILLNTAFSSLQFSVSQVVDSSITAEASASGKIDTLSGFLVDVIENGLGQLPDLESNTYGYIKIEGKYNLSDMLLITNNTKNEIIFNFVSNDTGAVANVEDASIVFSASDSDFPKYLQKTDGVTTLRLNYDTSSHAATDDIQIFIELTENGKSISYTRPFDFGTDAIERMRVAQPKSMLDADFEYGLQPTKWSAIGMMRGYPSIYEVPGSEKNVKEIITDASAGSSGVGQSLITVTTIGPHGLEAGNPVTIKALNNAVAGAARAEGSFVIITVPDTTTFTYYAKAKVGTTTGDVLSTSFTQLREAGFYTGANISVQPTFALISNGFNGDMVAELNVASGSTIIPYDGNTPELGAPLVHAGGNIPTGSQVTSAITQSAGGGLYLTADIVGDSNPGTNTLEVADPAGIITDLAFDRGDGTAIFVNNVAGSTVTFNDTFTRTILGGDTTYQDVSGSNINGIGFDASFDISISGGSYTVDTIADGGEAYEVGDRILVTADKVGGITPANDLVIIVDSVFSIGVIDAVSVEGTAFDGTGSVAGLTPEVNGGLGFGAIFDLTYENGVYNSVTIDTGGEAYEPYDVIVIGGDNISGGASPTNDAIITVATVDSVGEILTATVSGTSPDGQAEYDPITSSDYVYSGSTGTGAELRINRAGTVYSATVTGLGSNYLPTETLVIDGTTLGGASGTNDCTVTIDNVNGSGGITAVSVSGTAANVGSAGGNSGTNRVGTSADFTVDISAGTYSVTINQGGQDYGVNQTFTILGSEVAGADVTNDLTITINTVTDGLITAVTATGTANNGTATFSGVSGTNQDPTGSGALFDVRRNAGTYTVTLENGGNDYAVGNRITLLGTQLGGQSPLNDITLTVDTVTTGVIDTFTPVYEEAVLGDVGDFIATVTMSEATTNIISQGDAITFEALATLEITFPQAHGLVPGDTFIVTQTSDDGSNLHSLAAGAFIATSLPAVDKIRYQARAPGNIDTTSEDIVGEIYPRPDSFFTHRPYDGGVQLGTGGPQHGAQAIRQSKNYIRYQSGKGIMYTTGALFAPSYDLQSVTSNGVEVGSTITVVTDDNDHGVQVGGVIRLIGIETEGYNSGPETYLPPVFDYTVTNVVDERTFQVLSQRRLGSTTATLGFAAQMSVVSWHGSTVRSGIFDDQNGIFWEYDGTQLSVVQRTGTKQVAGTIAISIDENIITGTNTRFRDQLKAGDRIIIKGMTHVVAHVDSQTSMTVTPDFRGVINIEGAKAMLITDKKVKQSEFNLDRMDGTGTSGYNFDYAKMQMIGIQYSWYGAGFIDYMVRGADGNFVFAHRMRNSNVNTEAFMRSGNLPVRYEVTNEGPPGRLVEDMTDSQTTLTLEDSSFFPDTGTIYIDNEVMRYTANDKVNNQLEGLTRGSSLSNFQAGASRSYSGSDAAAHDAKTGVILISSTTTPLISHWGSAFITDGLFDDDRGYIFSYTEPSVNVSTTKQTAFLIRLSPSVSNAIVGDLGERELLNRAQLLLQGIEVTSDTGTGGIVIEGVLNPKNYPINPSNILWATLNTEAQGGQPSFAQVASGASVQWSTGEAAVTRTALASSNLSVQLNSGQNNTGSNRDLVWISATDYRNTFGTSSLTPVQGKTLSGTSIQAGTTITGGYISPSSNYGYFRISPRTTGNIARNVSNAVTVEFSATLTDRNFAYFAKASFETAGAAAGTAVSNGGDVNFPANSSVSSVQLQEFAGTEYYEVTFNNSFSGTLNAGTGTIEFTFEQPPYAQPGETVFSFIAQPGERSALMLDELKELTNTTLGGRGTFPNGPDVLAINVYKVSGSAIDSNIILRWGEAQA